MRVQVQRRAKARDDGHGAAAAIHHTAPLCLTTQPAEHSTRYDDLTRLFGEWRTFQQPTHVTGVPDYSAPAMARQQRELAGSAR